MRRLLAALLIFVGALVFVAGLAQAQLTQTGAGKKSGGGGAAPTFVAGAATTTVQVNGFAAGTITFSNLNGGVNYPNSAIVVVGIFQDQSATTLTSPQIGGTAASLVTGAQDSSTRCSLYFATMSGSTTDNFTFTNGNAVDRVGAAAAYMTGVNATAAAASNETYGANSNPQTPAGAITVPATGFGIAFVGAKSSAPTSGPGTNALTWTNTTAAGGDTNGGPLNPLAQVGLAHRATSGSWTPTASDAGNLFNFAACMSVAAWGP